MTAPDGLGFHAGELAVQRRAGVVAEASRLAGMVAPAELRGGMVRFLAERTFAAITARDHDGRLWVSPLTGPPGFLHAQDPRTLVVRGVPPVGDPLHRIGPDQPIGLLVIDLASRRRVRINGVLGRAEGGILQVLVEQAYGNCPQYIQQRVLAPADLPPPADVRRSDRLLDGDAELVRGADTIVVGTTHPARGADASHRGGPPGFIRVDGSRLWWPDYAGNNMFNTLGNLAVDPTAAVLVPDFRTGTALQLSGTATVEWSAPGSAGDDDGTGRRVVFTPDAVVTSTSLALRADTVVPYADNPPITGPAVLTSR